VRGPVGSLEIPDERAEHELLDAGGIALYVHRDVLAGLADPARLSFAFGRFGRCFVRLDAEA